MVARQRGEQLLQALVFFDVTSVKPIPSPRNGLGGANRGGEWMHMPNDEHRVHSRTSRQPARCGATLRFIKLPENLPQPRESVARVLPCQSRSWPKKQ